MSTRPELWWRSQPHTLTWICASSTWQVSRAWGAKWQPDKEGGCTGNSCWDRGDPDQAVLRAAAWVALHSSVHLICHYHRTRALQASRDGQRKARIDKEAPHHVTNSLLRHVPWQLHTTLLHMTQGVAMSPCCVQWRRPFLLPGASSGHGREDMSHYQLINRMEKESLLCSTVFFTSYPIHRVEQIINSSVSWARLEQQKMSLSWQETIFFFIFFKMRIQI